MINSMNTAANNPQLPILIMVRGIPGSGKSFVASRLQQLIGPEKTVMLDPDAIDKNSPDYRTLVDELTQQDVDAKLHPYRYLRAQAYDGITTQKAVIWNQAFTDFTGLERTIIRLRDYAEEHSIHLPVLVVEVEIDEATAKQRVAARVNQGGHDVPIEAFGRFIEQYKTFAGHGYATVTINGNDAIDHSMSIVESALHKLDD